LTRSVDFANGIEMKQTIRSFFCSLQSIWK